ncbi:UTRA domain-containing protein [Streptomyces malaysiensis]|uniref:UTRA domain-containing protein n=1 Tax=Streptomyces malaysiensis subsp. samsunensis TaxID=459658 RepID=A0A9X2LYC2_STRMQ|nr:UTRA domain-containing protein [Streptomyces samsunensis]MCQ8831804.1 UTRA domain-containing protein [Streptomyces samsunensis]
MADMQRQSDSLAYITPRSDGQADTWSEEARHRGGQRLTDVAEVIPSNEVASALRLSPGEKAAVRRRAILLDGDVIELADSYYPLSIARGTALAEKRKIKGGAPTLLAKLGFQPHHVTEDLEFRVADELERAALALPEGASVLTLLRITSAEDGSPHEVQFMVMKAPRRLHYEIEVD